MQHPAINDEVRELASMYAAGALSPQEEAEFQQHLNSCGVCAEEARAFREAVSWLPMSSSGVAAPARVREKLLARIQQPAWQSEQSRDFRIVRADEGAWRAMIPGVMAKRLYTESAAGNAAGNAAMLVRMEAGAQFPPHWHADVEHCYVLEGDLHFGDLALGPGDYQCAMASTTHITSHTEKGCMVLIVASQQNQILPWIR
jgi:anti-sigma factor ChrR (cupin superfamily)